MTTSPDHSSPKRRSWRRWPPEAVALIQQKKNPVALCEELASTTGNDKRACWRFLNKHGVKRPGSGSRRRFDPRTVNALIDYVCDHGVQAAANRMNQREDAIRRKICAPYFLTIPVPIPGTASNSASFFGEDTAILCSALEH